MDEILELVHIVNRNKVKTIEVIGNPTAQKTLVQDFYEKVSEGTILSDEEASKYFYGSTPKDRRYKDLKKRLIERLHTTSLFIDVNQARYDNASKAYYNCWKDIASAKVLAGKGAQIGAYKSMEKTLKTAQRFGFSDIAVDLAKTLRLFYATQKFDKKKYHYYNAIYQEYREQYEAEALAEDCYCQSQLDYYGISEKDLPAACERSLQRIALLEPLAKKYGTYKINLPYFLIRHNTYLLKRDYKKAMATCEEAVTFFSDNLDFSKTAVGIFMRQLFLLYWQERTYEKGEALLKEALHYTREGDMSWYVNQGYFFLLCLHVKEYHKAHDTIRKAMDHVRFKSIPDWTQQKWSVYRAYIVYLGELGKIEKVAAKKFRVQRFLNDVPAFTKDKRNQNIPLLIIQILFLLHYKRYHDMIDRLEAIDKYCSRYLKKDDTFRSNCFIKMLLKIVESDFNRVAARRKAIPLRKKLDEVPFEAAKQVLEIEIIPYEDLWELALESLDR